MADIFLSYAREDREKAERLAKALEAQGWSVFWDLTIPAGETWDTYISGELEKARCVMVAWSTAAVTSRWVREEAREGAEREILVPAFFEVVKPPFGFRSLQGPDLSEGKAEPGAPAFQALVQGIERILGQAAKKPPKMAAVASAVYAPGPPPPMPSVNVDPEEVARAAFDGPAWGTGAPSREDDEKLNRRILIKGGEFLMGSPKGYGYDDEWPQHLVRLSSFYLQEHPVTRQEYARFRPDHQLKVRRWALDHERFRPPHRFQLRRKRYPVEHVTWEEAAAYAEWLGGRLPTEAEWEYAYRAGTNTTYWSGDSEEDLASTAWFKGQPGGRPHPVTETPANPWGIHDMHVNVGEWVSDWYEPAEYARLTQGLASGQAVKDPSGPTQGRRRAIRGGGFSRSPEFARAACRESGLPEDHSDQVGFRVAFDAAPGDKED